MEQVPLIVVTGYLGAGKTTFLRHVLQNTEKRVAVIMNEFGEENIDADIIERDTFHVAELEDGCVCCALTGAFTHAVNTIVDEYDPDFIVVETTGVAEPDNVVMLVQDLDQVYLEGVVTVADAAALNQFDSLGYTGRVQLEIADVILLNKIDLVDDDAVEKAEARIREGNGDAPILRTVDAAADLDTILTVDASLPEIGEPRSHAQAEEALHWRGGTVNQEALRSVLAALPDAVRRVKGFAHTPRGTFLVQYASGHATLEEWDEEKEGTRLVVIGGLDEETGRQVEEEFARCEV